MLIVAQVAATVAVLPIAFRGSAKWIRVEFARPASATERVRLAMLVLDEQEPQAQPPEANRSVARQPATLDAIQAGLEAHDHAVAARFARLRTEVVRRLEAEPGVADIAVASEPPGDEPSVRVEVESPAITAMGDAQAASLPTSSVVHLNRVGPGFFRTFDVPMLAGRRFQAGDFSSKSSAVIVSRSFVLKIFGSGNPLGRRVRAAAREDATAAHAPGEAWDEIVGVVPDFPNSIRGESSDIAPTLYRPLLPTDVRSAWLAIRLRAGSASSASVASRLREITVAVNPMLRLGNVATLDEIRHRITWADRLFDLLLTLLAVSTLLLSAAGIYALVSLTVARRREIGVRLALGGQPRRLLVKVLGRTVRQVAIGIVLGAGMFALIDSAVTGRLIGGRDIVRVLATAALVAAVGLIAAIGPARRALRIQPTEALKAE